MSFKPRSVYRTNENGRTSRHPLTGRMSPTAFTAEQYQQHQEQLALMHREQLEQVQLQQQANSTAAANSTHVSLLANTHMQPAAVWPPALSNRRPPPLRVWPTLWTRPAHSSPPPPSSPLTNCSLSKPRRSSAPEAESTASSPPQVRCSSAGTAVSAVEQASGD